MKKIMTVLIVTMVMSSYFSTDVALAIENDSTILELIVPVITSISKENNTTTYDLKIVAILGCPPSEPHPNSGKIGFGTSVGIYSTKNTVGTPVQLTYTIYDNSGVIIESGVFTETSSFVDNYDDTIVTISDYPHIWVDVSSRVFKMEARASMPNGITVSSAQEVTFYPSLCN